MKNTAQRMPLKSNLPIIFLSWSGDHGKRVAEEIAKWLPLVLPQVKPWVSTRGIETGRDYFTELTRQAQSSAACIICVTQDTSQSTWVAFEAGLAYANPKCLVCPIVFSDFMPDELGPLGHLQLRRATPEGMTQCLEDVIVNLGITDKSLAGRITQLWKQLEEALDGITHGSTSQFPRHSLKLSPELENRAIDLIVSNTILTASTKLELLALTYETLSKRIRSMQFPNLVELTVRAYAVPNQKHSHPLHQGNYSALIDEWTRSIISLIEGFCDSKRCPKLEKLDFVLLSTTPDFTGTHAEWQHGSLRGNRLRMTLCVSGIQMDELPTFIIDDDPNRRTYSFAQFLQLFHSTGQRPGSPLVFELFTRHSPHQFIKQFAERAATVTNHPGSVGSTERLFAFEVRSRDLSPSKPVPNLSSNQIPNLLKGPLVQSTNPARRLWTVVTDGHDNLLTLTLARADPAHVSTLHFYANFVALLIPSEEGYEIVLINHRKDPWDYDVPGGKFSSADRDAQSNVCREVFEELGWLLDFHRLKGPVGLSYELKSSREGGTPGLIQYFYYVLDRREDWHCGETAPQKSTKGHSLKYMKLEDLIAEKRNSMRPDEASEPKCHFPLKVLEEISSDLESFP